MQRSPICRQKDAPNVDGPSSRHVARRNVQLCLPGRAAILGVSIPRSRPMGSTCSAKTKFRGPSGPYVGIVEPLTALSQDDGSQIATGVTMTARMNSPDVRCLRRLAPSDDHAWQCHDQHEIRRDDPEMTLE